MEITPQTGFSRIQILDHAFRHLEESYRAKNITITWNTDSDGVVISPEYLWNKHAQDVGSVRGEYMDNTETHIDRHKIISLTGRVIHAVQPLIFTKGIESFAHAHYLLNAEYSLYFGIQYLASWNNTYQREPFYPDEFFNTFLETDKGFEFLQEYIKLVCTKGMQSLPVFWGSQFWFLVEQWGLTYMKLMTTYPRLKQE
jgi:hypothetical protein